MLSNVYVLPLSEPMQAYLPTCFIIKQAIIIIVTYVFHHKAGYGSSNELFLVNILAYMFSLLSELWFP